MSNVIFPNFSQLSRSCPSCSAANTQLFYEVKSIPTDSSMLFLSRESALSHGKATMRLAFCPTCGFIFNSAFDPSIHKIDVPYEDSQGHSATFNAFAKSLAQRWIDRYQLISKSIVEIGCGKGEFLKTMCGLARAKGIGIDPRHRPEHDSPNDPPGMQFFSELYGSKFENLKQDFIVCRHTFEHIPAVAEFLQLLRKTIGDNGPVVGFEVPDTIRVLDEGAFWDIYYEHCSYFTPGSLVRLFRRSGFEILDVELLYKNQYLILEARPGANGKTFALEESIADLRKHVEKFMATTSATINKWQKFFSETKGQKIVVWGSGSKGVGFLTTLGLTGEVEYVVDINPFRSGKFMPATGQQILHPKSLKDYKPGHVIIMNPIYRDEITRDLAQMGLHPNILAA